MICTDVIKQYADVSVPIKVNPYAVVQDITIECCGEPITSCQCNANNCACERHNGCEIVIAQTICMKISVKYGVTANTCDACIDCKGNNLCQSRQNY